MAKYNLDKLGLGAGLLNDKSKDLLLRNTLEITYIDYNDLEIDVDNQYSVDEDSIDELADSIKDVGLQQNLTVMDAGNGKFSILAGQRRYLAIGKILAAGDVKYERVPCHVINLQDIQAEGLSDDLKKLYVIATTNRYRNLTTADELLMAAQLDQVYSAMKKEGIIIGQRKREFVAETMGVSPRKAQDMLTVNKGMTDELKTQIENEELNLKDAVELVRSNEVRQDEKKDKEVESPISIDKEIIWNELNLASLEDVLKDPIEISKLEMEAITRAGNQISRIIARLQKKIDKRQGSPNE